EWQAVPADAEPLPEVSRCTGRAFQAAIAQARSAAEPADGDEAAGHVLPPVEWLGPAQMVAHWLDQARALAAWLRLVRRFPASAADRGRAALAGRCERLAAEVQPRHGKSGLASLFRRRPRDDRALFEAARG